MDSIYHSYFILFVSFILNIKNVTIFEGNLSISFYPYLLFMASSLDFPHREVMYSFKNYFYNKIKKNRVNWKKTT